MMHSIHSFHMEELNWNGSDFYEWNPENRQTNSKRQKNRQTNKHAPMPVEKRHQQKQVQTSEKGCG